MKLYELADYHGDDLLKLVPGYFKFLLNEAFRGHLVETLHQLVITVALLQELVKGIQILQLVEDPWLLELHHDSLEELREHLQQVTVL